MSQIHWYVTKRCVCGAGEQSLLVGEHGDVYAAEVIENPVSFDWKSAVQIISGAIERRHIEDGKR